MKPTTYLIVAVLMLCFLLAGCLSPHYPRAQQLLADLQQQGIEFKADSPPLMVGALPLFPPELYPLTLFVYLRKQQGTSLPPDHLLMYIAYSMDQATAAQRWTEDFAQAVYGLHGIDMPAGMVLHYYRCAEVIVVYQVWGKATLDPAVDKVLTDRCGPPFVCYPL